MTALARLQQQAEQAKEQAQRLDNIVKLAEQLGEDGLAELVEWVAADSHDGNGNGNGSGNVQKGPRGRDAVRRIVQERPGIWTLAELRKEMEARGWYTTASGLQNAVRRLCDVNGEGRRAGRGRYVFPANHGEEGAIESDPSGGAMIPLTTV